jgi:lysophospholipase L1-like esterase
MVKNLLDWAKARYGNQLLDLHEAVQSKYTVGPAMQSAPMIGEVPYTDDQTHPNVAGYDALGEKAVDIFPSVYAAARAAQMTR